MEFAGKSFPKRLVIRSGNKRKLLVCLDSSEHRRARIMDPILLVSFALTIVGNLTGSIPEGVLLAVMAIMLFTFYLHMIVNGRVYRYMTMSERKEKKSEKEGN